MNTSRFRITSGGEEAVLVGTPVKTKEISQYVTTLDFGPINVAEFIVAAEKAKTVEEVAGMMYAGVVSMDGGLCPTTIEAPGQYVFKLGKRDFLELKVERGQQRATHRISLSDECAKEIDRLGVYLYEIGVDPAPNPIDGAIDLIKKLRADATVAGAYVKDLAPSWSIESDGTQLGTVIKLGGMKVPRVSAMKLEVDVEKRSFNSLQLQISIPANDTLVGRPKGELKLGSTQ